jgi:hypothetical protein
MQENNSVVHRRGRVSAARISQLIEQYRASGLTQLEFAASVDIGYSTFTGWLYRRRRTSGQQGKSWVAVDVVQPAPATAAGRYQLELPNGARVSVRPGFDAQELAHLLKLVGTCSA